MKLTHWSGVTGQRVRLCVCVLATSVMIKVHTLLSLLRHWR